MATSAPSTVDHIVKLTDIVRIDGRNPRTVFDKAALKELAAQIKEAKGVLTPILVEKRNEDNQYPLVDGERRYRALTMLAEEGLVFDVPVHVVSPKTNGEAIYQALISNEGVPLDLFDMARAVVSLVNDHGMDRKQVYTSMGKTHGWLSQRFTLASATVDLVKKYRSGELGVQDILTLLTEEKAEKKTPSVVPVAREEKIGKKVADRAKKKAATKSLHKKEKQTGTKLSPLQKQLLTFLGSNGIDGLVVATQAAVAIAVETTKGRELKSWIYIADMLEIMADALSEAPTDSPETIEKPTK